MLSRIDVRLLPVVACLMIMSLLVISSMTSSIELESFWTPLVKSQLRWFCLGWAVFFLMAYFDYRRLRDISPFLYIFTLILLIGIFFVNPIQNVHRWYRIEGLGSFQPSEQAKLVIIIFLSWFIERKGREAPYLKTTLLVGLIVGVPFLLILKQPDLGTALVLYPIALIIGFFGDLHKGALKMAALFGILGIIFSACIFCGVVNHEKMRPFFTQFMKEYQYERLNPNTYHQKASQIALAVGGITGTGWRKGEFSGRKWLPAAHTDSVFAAFGEEFGLVGVGFMLFLFYALIYFSFQVVAVAKDPFGRLLAAGLSGYLAMHVLVNTAMMSALLPISGVPLIFITYGGSSVITTMAALGLLQSIYSRRFMF